LTPPKKVEPIKRLKAITTNNIRTDIMNAATIVIFGLIWFIFAYNWYGRIIQKKLIGHSDKLTPANEVNDGMDYVPTKSSILFGHHFSSIAGAGPIVGPIFAFALFGWLPALLWILVGSVFMGAVHDYAALMVSVRHRGVSLVEITGNVISNRAKIIFAVFVWMTLVLIQAVFADLTAKTLTEKPEIVLPTLGIMLIAVIFGIAVFRKGFNTIAGTILGLAALFGLILLGEQFPIVLSHDTWLIFAVVYSLVAATLPVWLLLQPRDYLSMYLLIIGLLLGLIGTIVLAPEINAPAFTGFNSIKGPMFPMLFIIVACGAISGFHSLVSSGTTAKQLNLEKEGRLVSFGSMLTEGFLALLVIVMIASVLKWNPGAGSIAGEYIFQNLMTQSANIVFGTALGLTTESLGIPLALGISFGVLMLNAFILTTLDTSARLSRYIVQETLGKKYGGIFNNRFFATGSGLVLAYLLCLGGGYKVLWPVFGSSNQLIATIALFVVTVYFTSKQKPKYFTLIPAIIMLIVTESALAYQIFWLYIPTGHWTLLIISSILFSLGLMIAIEVFSKLKETKKSIKEKRITP